ncbi:hypothetical protein D9M71_671240 [compost metagenome]
MGGIDAGNHLGQVAGTGQGLEALGIEAVEADVQARQAGIEQRLGQAGELRAIAGHAQLAQARQGGNPGAQLDDARAHQRLAAGQADLAGAHGDKAFSKLIQLFKGEDALARQELHVFGHAIDAAKVAAVGDRHAQVIDFPTVAVDQLFAVCTHDGQGLLYRGRDAVWRINL